MNIKKQIQLIYTSAIFKTVTLTGVWVALLAARGFSMSSFTYSVLMIVMSPLAGYFFSKW